MTLTTDADNDETPESFVVVLTHFTSHEVVVYPPLRRWEDDEPIKETRDDD